MIEKLTRAELSLDQKHIADAMGVSYEAYAKRAGDGVSVGGRRNAAYRFYLHLRWYGLPSVPATEGALSASRVDRGAFPKVVSLSEEDRRVVAVPIVPEGGSVQYRSDPTHQDVVRIELGLWRWGAVAALYAVRQPWRFPRFGLDFVSQFGAGNWHDLVIRFYRR